MKAFSLTRPIVLTFAAVAFFAASFGTAEVPGAAAVAAADAVPEVADGAIPEISAAGAQKSGGKVPAAAGGAADEVIEDFFTKGAKETADLKSGGDDAGKVLAKGNPHELGKQAAKEAAEKAVSKGLAPDRPVSAVFKAGGEDAVGDVFFGVGKAGGDDAGKLLAKGNPHELGKQAAKEAAEKAVSKGLAPDRPVSAVFKAGGEDAVGDVFFGVGKAGGDDAGKLAAKGMSTGKLGLLVGGGLGLAALTGGLIVANKKDKRAASVKKKRYEAELAQAEAANTQARAAEAQAAESQPPVLAENIPQETEVGAADPRMLPFKNLLEKRLAQQEEAMMTMN